MTGKDVITSGCAGDYGVVAPPSVDMSGWSDSQAMTMKGNTVRHVERVLASGEVVYGPPTPLPDVEFKRKRPDIRYVGDETFKKVYAELIEKHGDLFQALADSDLD